MKVDCIRVRFYKAFNYDYLRKFHARSTPRPWEVLDDGSWYPFIDVPLSGSISTIVGANESGKSQILKALEIALTGEGVVRSDFCRYSRFFVVEGDMPAPDFGVTISGLTDSELQVVAGIAGGEQSPRPHDPLTLIRRGDGSTWLHWPTGDQAWESRRLKAPESKKMTAILPKPFWLDAAVPLPSSVPIIVLAEPDGLAGLPIAGRSRRTRQGMVERLFKLNRDFVESAETVTKHAAAISSAFSTTSDGSDAPVSEAEIKLAQDLLLKVAGISPEHFVDLAEAVSDGRDGYVNGIEEEINRALATRLNFKRWWSQDSDFQLRVSVRESDLAFIIRDRTGTDYSFTERSNGLRYFLAYFVQYLAHEPPDDRHEILLMDEPDAYLSSEGQRDLLKVFDAFAFPTGDDKPCAVVYVTHSPFLIDRNHAERIVVLEKGDGDEGTRVVRDVARNHYEPLRSAFGSFVAETTFMGSCNLVVEGPADQVLLASVSTHLLRLGAPRTSYLDLNDITIVPAGGAPHVPYLVYLARGRDVEKPAVVVLLDGDQAGDDARRAIKKGGAYRGRLLDDDLVLQLTDDELTLTTCRTDGNVELEDLIPEDLARLATVTFATEYLRADPDQLLGKIEAVDGSAGIHAGSEAALQSVLGADAHLDKVGFARHCVELLKGEGLLSSRLEEESRTACIASFEALFNQLGKRQRMALLERQETQVAERVARIRDGFLADFPDQATKVDVQLLFEQLGHALDDSQESEDIRSEMRRLERTHDLTIDPSDPIADHQLLRDELARLSYLGRHASAEPGDIVEVDGVVRPASPENGTDQ